MLRARPSRDPREAILDQLAYLIDEMEAVEPLIGRVPDAILSGRPWEGELTIKEIFGLIAASDERLRQPNLERIVAEDDPQLAEIDSATLVAREPWNESALPDLLRRVRTAREALVRFLTALPADEWLRGGLQNGVRRTVYDLAYGYIQEDTDHLRALGSRLHESHITTRAQDLPK